MLLGDLQQAQHAVVGLLGNHVLRTVAPHTTSFRPAPTKNTKWMASASEVLHCYAMRDSKMTVEAT